MIVQAGQSPIGQHGRVDADMARDLANAAKKVTTWTERRNTLIREAVASGAGIREVARACDLNHATVINIVKPRGRRDH